MRETLMYPATMSSLFVTNAQLSQALTKSGERQTSFATVFINFSARSRHLTYTTFTLRHHILMFSQPLRTFDPTTGNEPRK
jgi:hypothetical protein